MAYAHRERLLASCFGFLVPIVRFLLDAGITYREFDELARNAFVSIASNEYGLRGRETSHSRVSIMTGISRKEVARMRQAAGIAQPDTREFLSPLADLVTKWSSHPDWLDATGSPLVLPYEGEPPSFTALSSSVVGDRPAGAVRKELERLGVIRISESSQVVLLRPHLVPTPNEEKLISAMTYSLRGLAATIAHNCSRSNADDETWVERFIESGDISAEDFPKVRELVNVRLEELSREVEALVSSCNGPASPSTRRLGVGLFYSE